MPYSIEFEPDALKDWYKLQAAPRERFKKMLAKRLENPRVPSAQVSAIDVSEKALEMARKNAINNDVEINFTHQNILETESLDEKYDIIVSNPPYVRNLEKQEIKRNVLPVEEEVEQEEFDDEDDFNDNYLYAEAIDEVETLSLEAKEIELIKKSLEKNKGKRKAAADELGISERTLYRKIKQYDL